MKINVGDYVTLKSIKEMESLYNNWKTIRDEFGKTDCAFSGDEYYSHEMLDAMQSPNVYKVIEVKEDKFLLILSIFIDDRFWFNNRCIKDVYKVIKIS